MINLNQDLQATHQILTLLEQSKSKVDTILDRIPGIFAIIDSNGNVLKFNLNFSSFLGIRPEEGLWKSVYDLFSKEKSDIFRLNLKKVIDSEKETVDFELSVDAKEGELVYFWNISKFFDSTQGGLALFKVIGKDVTELRNSEKRIAEIFASIPVAIFSVDQNGKIEDKYSSYSEWLLGTSKIANESFIDLIFKKGMDRLTVAEKAALQSMSDVFQKDELYFDALKSSLPKEIFFPMEGASEQGGRYLGVVFQPVSYNGKIGKLLLVLDDKTELVIAKKNEEKFKILEEKSISRILQIKKAAPDILPLVMDELGQLFERLASASRSSDAKALAIALHAVKGNSRIIGFDFLKEMAHATEDKLKGKDDRSKVLNWTEIQKDIADLSQEWQELKRISSALSGEKTETVQQSTAVESSSKLAADIQELFSRYNSLLSNGYSPETALIAERINLTIVSLSHLPLESIRGLLEARVRETAKQLNKEVNFEFHTKDVRVDEQSKSVISECLLHLLNNAIAHGIESPEIREKNGKSRVGTLKVTVQENFGLLECSVIDDGAGIHVERIKAIAVKRGLISLETAVRMPSQEAMQLIFQAGFSTADKVDDIAGRGVGLDAVVSNINKLDGSISVQNRPEGGAQFKFTMRATKKNQLQRILLPVGYFLAQVKKSIVNMAEHEGFSVDVSALDPIGDDKKGMIYCDFGRLILSLTTYIGNVCQFSPTKLAFKRPTENLLEYTIEKDASKVVTVDSIKPEFRIPLVLCNDYIHQHQGAVIESESNISIVFGHVLNRNDFEKIPIYYSGNSSSESFSNTLQRFQEAAKELDLNIEFFEANEESKLDSSSILIENLSKLGVKNWGCQVMNVGVSYELIRKTLLNAVENLLGISKNPVSHLNEN